MPSLASPMADCLLITQRSPILAVASLDVAEQRFTNCGDGKIVNGSFFVNPVSK
ncbi:hypothetical protein J6590_068635 [Homalodisca vitripennis]|nr:hypothetical protein J6590_068635 [Homalodisca vitripennis]